MSKFIGLILIAANMFCARSATTYRSVETNRNIGTLPEMVITAPRYEGEDIAYSGMLGEIVIIAPSGPEIGMLDEIVINASHHIREDMLFSRIIPNFLIGKSRTRIIKPEPALVGNLRRSLLIRNMDL